MTRKVPVTTDLYGGLGLEDNDAEEDKGGAALGALEDVDDFESLRNIISLFITKCQGRIFII